jgi:DNA polymerase-3 subunit delta
MPSKRRSIEGAVPFDQFERGLGAGRIGSAYFFAGDEPYFLSEGVRLIRKGLEASGDEVRVHRLDAHDLAELGDLSGWGRGELFGAVRRLVVIDQAGSLAKGAETLPEQTEWVWVFRDKGFPSDLAGFPMASGMAWIECRPLPAKRLADWVRRRAQGLGLRFSAQGFSALLEQVGLDAGALASELEKLRSCLSGPGSKAIGEETVRALVGDAFSEAPFELAEAVGERRSLRAVEVVQRHLDTGVPPVQVVGQLAWQLRRLRRAGGLLAGGRSPAEVGRILGIPSFLQDRFFRQVQRQAGRRSGRKERTLLWRLDAACKGEGGDVRASLTSALARLLAAFWMVVVPVLTGCQTSKREAASAPEAVVSERPEATLVRMPRALREAAPVSPGEPIVPLYAPLYAQDDPVRPLQKEKVPAADRRPEESEAKRLARALERLAEGSETERLQAAAYWALQDPVRALMILKGLPDDGLLPEQRDLKKVLEICLAVRLGERDRAHRALSLLERQLRPFTGLEVSRLVLVQKPSLSFAKPYPAESNRLKGGQKLSCYMEVRKLTCLEREQGEHRMEVGMDLTLLDLHDNQVHDFEDWERRFKLHRQEIPAEGYITDFYRDLLGIPLPEQLNPGSYKLVVTVYDLLSPVRRRAQGHLAIEIE